MQITTPHMGNIYIAAKALFDTLGISYIIPPLSNKSSIDLGSLHSPEEMCLPFKIMIGNYLQAIEQGADTVLIVGSCGPCRFGEYCEMQMNLLKNMGYNVKFVVIDNPKEIGIMELFNRIKKISSVSSKTKYEKLKAIIYAKKVINLMDKIESDAHRLAGYEMNKGQCKRLLYECKSKAISCKSAVEMIDLLQNYEKKINTIQIDDTKKPIKIAIIGEIYTVIEPFSNLYIEDKLMDYGVSSCRTLSPSWWVNNLILSPIKLNQLDIKKHSKKYLSEQIGGHARECVGEAVLAYKKGCDGAIQILPMGCMPEIVSKSILPTISKDHDFPIMTLVVDEMTGEAGFNTRIEAFIDLLERRKQCII